MFVRTDCNIKEENTEEETDSYGVNWLEWKWITDNAIDRPINFIEFPKLEITFLNGSKNLNLIKKSSEYNRRRIKLISQKKFIK